MKTETTYTYATDYYGTRVMVIEIIENTVRTDKGFYHITKLKF